MKNQTNRRTFFKKALAVSGTLASVGAMAEGNKVKMLTPDGKLVEVDASLIEKSPKSKATNKDLLDWSEQIQK